MKNHENKIFLICPVRGITNEESLLLQDYISGLEAVGAKVHYPPRDTNQDDPVGLNICSENREGIKNALGVSLYYNPASKGTVFDIGMTFMAEKPLFIINLEAIRNPSPSDLERFLGEYAINSGKHTISDFYASALSRAEEIRKSKRVEYEWKDNSREFLFDFGMALMSEKPIMLLNREYVETKVNEDKSFQKVLLKLDDIYRPTCCRQ